MKQKDKILLQLGRAKNQLGLPDYLYRLTKHKLRQACIKRLR